MIQRTRHSAYLPDPTMGGPRVVGRQTLRLGGLGRLRGFGQFGNHGDGGVFGGFGGAGEAHVVVSLQIEPEFGADAEGGAEADGGVRCDAAPAFDQIIDAADADGGGLCQPILTDADGLQEFVEEDLARVCRTQNCGAGLGFCGFGFCGFHFEGMFWNGRRAWRRGINDSR